MTDAELYERHGPPMLGHQTDGRGAAVVYDRDGRGLKEWAARALMREHQRRHPSVPPDSPEEGRPMLLTLQNGGWPRQYVVWVTAEAGASPPPRDWRGGDWKAAVQAALRDLGVAEARVVRVADADDQYDSPDEDWGVVRAPGGGPPPGRR